MTTQLTRPTRPPAASRYQRYLEFKSKQVIQRQPDGFDGSSNTAEVERRKMLERQRIKNEDSAALQAATRIENAQRRAESRERAKRSQSALRKRAEAQLDTDHRERRMEQAAADERALTFEQQRLAQAQFESDEAMRLKLSLKERREKDSARRTAQKRLDEMKAQQIEDRRLLFEAQKVQTEEAAELENDRVRQSIRDMEASVSRRARAAKDEKERELMLISSRMDLHEAERAEQLKAKARELDLVRGGCETTYIHSVRSVRVSCIRILCCRA